MCLWHTGDEIGRRARRTPAARDALQHVPVLRQRLERRQRVHAPTVVVIGRPCVAGADIAGLARRPGGRHRADRQRDQRRAGGGAVGVDGPDTDARSTVDAGCGGSLIEDA